MSINFLLGNKGFHRLYLILFAYLTILQSLNFESQMSLCRHSGKVYPFIQTTGKEQAELSPWHTSFAQWRSASCTSPGNPASSPSASPLMPSRRLICSQPNSRLSFLTLSYTHAPHSLLISFTLCDIFHMAL